MAWIFDRNLGAWCDAVSVLLGAALSAKEWEDIRRGVSSATAGGNSFHFRLGERDAVEVVAQLDDPSDVVHVWIDPNPHPLDSKIDVITWMCRHFTIKGEIRRSEGAIEPDLAR